MTDHTPSGQQAVEPVAWYYELATKVYDSNPPVYDDWRAVVSQHKPNVPVRSLRNLTPLYLTAPTPPSTAAGEPPKHRGEYSTHQQQADACAALATPPAQSAPWQEQAAQIRRDALEEAARICRDEAMLCRRDLRLVPAVTAEACANLIRALLSKPAKGEG